MTPASKPRILLLHYGATGQVGQSFMAAVARVFEDIAHQGQIQLCEVGIDQDEAALLDAARKVHGIVTISIGSDSFLADLALLQKPMVVLDHEPLGRKVDSVSFDNFGAAEELGKKIVELGHRDVLYVSRFYLDPKPMKGAETQIESMPSADRRNGLARAFEGTDVTLWGLFPWFSHAGGISHDAKSDARWRLDKTIKEVGKTPDCIVAVDYSVSEEIVALLRERKLTVPRDVSMADFQIFPRYAASDGCQPSTHMQLNFTQLGQEGWRLLSARLKNDPSSQQRLRLKCSFIHQGTLADRRVR